MIRSDKACLEGLDIARESIENFFPVARADKWKDCQVSPGGRESEVAFLPEEPYCPEWVSQVGVELSPENGVDWE